MSVCSFEYSKTILIGGCKSQKKERKKKKGNKTVSITIDFGFLKEFFHENVVSRQCTLCGVVGFLGVVGLCLAFLLETQFCRNIDYQRKSFFFVFEGSRFK